MNPQPQDEQLDVLLDYLQRHRGFDFHGYKRTSLQRRIQKRMQMVKIPSFENYVDYLEVHPEEFPQLFNTILIHVTAFFRDLPAWEYLAQEVLPQLVASKNVDAPIRIWSAGCASGEEACTLAMILAEHLGREAFYQRVKIYATDVDEEALVKARQASYSAKDLQAVPTALQEKYFEALGDRYLFRSDVRRALIFGRHDLISDAPISRLDMIVCRNTLMYFNAETQTRILTRLHFGLLDRGLLFLGRAEMLLTHANLFAPVELKHRIFKKVLQANHLRERFTFLGQASSPDPENPTSRHLRLRALTFDSAPVARIVLDFSGMLVLTTAQARTHFGLTPQDIGRPFQDLELSYRPADLRSLIEKAYTERQAITLPEIPFSLADGRVQYMDIEVTPLQEAGGSFLGVDVTFHDVTKFRQLQQDLQRAKHEVETAYAELQSSNEELETTNEELQSSNEELETTNEELQSSNEEMETLNEELQSTNEELQTLNDELRTRTDELSTTNAFLQSILGDLVAGVIVVDRHLNILVWNAAAQDQWGLRTDEVRGQSLLNLDIGLPVERLKPVIHDLLAGTTQRQELILDAVNRRGKAITCYLACSPLRDARKDIQGAVLLTGEKEKLETIFSSRHSATLS